MATTKKNWIGPALANSKKGVFKKEAEKHKESTNAYAKEVLSNPKTSKVLRKRATLAQTLGSLKHKK